MTTTTYMTLARRLGVLIDTLAECAFDAHDLDGFQCTQLLERAGLVTFREATDEDVDENSDYEVGDQVWMLTDFARECRKLALGKTK